MMAYDGVLYPGSLAKYAAAFFRGSFRFCVGRPVRIAYGVALLRVQPMHDREFYRQILGSQAPWEVFEVEIDLPATGVPPLAG